MTDQTHAQLRERIIETLIRLFDDEGEEAFRGVIERGGTRDEPITLPPPPQRGHPCPNCNEGHNED